MRASPLSRRLRSPIIDIIILPFAGFADPSRESRDYWSGEERQTGRGWLMEIGDWWLVDGNKAGGGMKVYLLWTRVKVSGGGKKLRRRHGDPLNGRVGGHRALKVFRMDGEGYNLESVSPVKAGGLWVFGLNAGF
jgi:hypothetical protein